jgi:hypothetical protein
MFEGPAVALALRTAGILPALFPAASSFSASDPMPLDTDYHSINDPDGYCFPAESANNAQIRTT